MTNAGVLMFESDPSTGLDQHRRENELWLAMQAAHDQWMNATEALHDLTTDAPGDFTSTDETLRNAKAVEEQRSAFEEYIEARLAFSEFVYDRNSRTGWDRARGRTRNSRSTRWLRDPGGSDDS